MSNSRRKRQEREARVERHPFSIEKYGSNHKGTWWLEYDRLPIVTVLATATGETKSTQQGNSDPEDVAKRLLRDLIRDNTKEA